MTAGEILALGIGAAGAAALWLIALELRRLRRAWYLAGPGAPGIEIEGAPRKIAGALARAALRRWLH